MRFVFFLFVFSATALAQANTCGGLISVTESGVLAYPPIAKAAHVEGLVILLATFKTSGEVAEITVVSGPIMLIPSATAFVRGWQANSYTGPRTCPIVVRYIARHVGCGESAGDDTFTRQDPQHVTLEAGFVPLCDPAADIRHKHRFLFF
jgi:hypothetical protein